MTEREPAGGHDVIILGAGCAGLSLCHHLLELGYAGHILILDQRTTHEDDRTWSFWDVEPTPFTHLASARWDAWEISAGGRTSIGTDAVHPYVSLRARDVYDACLRRIGREPRVELRLGESVVSCEERGDAVQVVTSEATYSAGRVFDARGLGPDSPEFELLRTTSTWVPQHFLGRRIVTSRPVFDPTRCSLMDFEVDQGRGPQFMYVLPAGPEEALVENVYFSFARVNPKAHRREIAEFLDRRYGLRGDEFEVVQEESGFIPMSDHFFPRGAGERITAVGTLAGATRASTGYAFLRIQRECAAVAEAFVWGVRPRADRDRRRRGLLDAVFLRFMVDRPAELPTLYVRMFERVPSGPLIRFLTERSSLPDELRLVMALPKAPFIGIVLRMITREAASRARALRGPRRG